MLHSAATSRHPNSTKVSFFVLTSYSHTGALRGLVFSVLLLLYLLILLFNAVLIAVIAACRSLHMPMYVLLCGLCLNQLYGSTGLFPFLLVHLLRDTHTVPAHLCFLQVYILHAYGIIEFFTLACMSYDRYVAICHPLHYHTLMSHRRTTALTLFPWTYGLVMMGVMISLSSSLELCSNVIDKMYCDNFPIVKLACGDTTAVNVYGMFGTAVAVSFPFTMIFYTYMRIMRVCRASKRIWHKALRTCLPHLVSVLNFTLAGCFEILQGRFDLRHVSNTLRIFLSVYFLVGQPLLNPLMYGLSMTEINTQIRVVLVRLCSRCSGRLRARCSGRLRARCSGRKTF